MENVDKRIARNTAIVLECLESMADLIDDRSYECDKDETADQIRQIDAAVTYLKQAVMLRRREGMKITEPAEKIIGGAPRPVLCVETGKVYESIAEAAKDTGINSGNISQAVRGLIRAAGGYHWMAYLEERPEPINRKHTQPVICVETGEIYGSLKEAQEKTGIRTTSISAVLSSNSRNKTAGGYHWEKYEEPKPEPRPQRATIGTLKLPKKRTNAKPVLCVDTNTVYESAAAAALDLDISRNQISQAVNGKAETAGGYKWRFADDRDK